MKLFYKSSVELRKLSDLCAGTIFCYTERHRPVYTAGREDTESHIENQIENFDFRDNLTKG